MKRPSLLTVKALLAQVFIINGLIAYPYLRGETRPECTRGPLCLSTKVDCKAVFSQKFQFLEREKTRHNRFHLLHVKIYFCKCFID